MDLKKLNKQITNCHKCDLGKISDKAVLGKGPNNAKIMLIGQNPGKEESILGKPFIGKSGKYLNEVLLLNKINRDDLFITNVVKHSTPNNRKPKRDEIKACLPYLCEQIKLIKPKIIVLMGNIAKRYVPRLKGIIYIETYHPASAMRFPRMGKKFEKDFQKLKKM